MAGESKQVTMYGADWCPDCDRVKRFLLERSVDFEYVNIDRDDQARERAVELAGGKQVIPVVVVGDEAKVNPANEDLAGALGLAEGEAEVGLYDVLIVGAGATGLSAAIYTTRERLKTLVVERMVPGGQIMTTAVVENYPGFPDPVGGAELTDRLVRQAERFGAELAQRTEVTRIERRDDCFVVSCEKDEEPVEYTARSVVLCPGSQYRKLGVPGEKELTGYGVSYCGTCDAPFYKGKHVVAVGGGNTAVEESVHLLKFVDRLTIIQDKDRLTASPFLVDGLMKHEDRVEILTRSTVTEIQGREDEHVTGVMVKDLDSGEQRDLSCDGVFVWIGMTPNTDFLRDTVELDEWGFIVAEACSMATSVAGLYAAGDCRSGSRKQLVTAAGEGVLAALMASEFLKRQKTGASQAAG